MPPPPTHSRLCVFKDSNSVRKRREKKMKKKKNEKCALPENARGLRVTHSCERKKEAVSGCDCNGSMR